MECLSSIPYPPLDERITFRQLPWETYYQSGQLTADQMSVLSDLEDRSRWSECFLKDPRHYVTLTFKSLVSLTERDPCLQIMMMIEQFISSYGRNISEVLQDTPDLAAISLEPLLRCPDQYVSSEAARLLYLINRLLGFCCCTIALVDWMVAGLQSHGSQEGLCEAASFFLQYHIRLKQFRSVFSDTPEGVNAMLDLLRAPRNSQIQYQTVFSLWIITFDRAIVIELQSRYEVIPLLLDVARATSHAKIARMCLACWVNFLQRAKRIAVPVMIGARVLEYLDHLAGRKVADEEMQADLLLLREELTKAYQSLNSYDEYASEIKSGKLQWSPPHKSSLFWQDNAARLEEKDGEMLRLLTRLLTHSHDPLVLSVAANDLGEYIWRRPQGRRYIDSMGTKQQLMHLMAHQNPDVRFSALNSVQKYMSNLWTT